jgi:hypothetical protein
VNARLRFALVGALALLASCVPWVRGGSAPAPAQLSVLDIVVEEWRSTLPWTDRCDRERELVQIALVDDAEMRRAAGYCAAAGPVCESTRVPGDTQATWNARAEAGCLLGTCAAGSTVWEQSEVWPVGLWSPQRVTLVISVYQDERTQHAAIAHEAGHWLDACALGGGRDHRNEQIWGADGVVARAIREL